MSFHEKSAWGSLIAILLVYCPYFVFVFQNPVTYIWLFVIAVILLVILLTVCHILFVLRSPVVLEDGDVRTDEMDRMIERRSQLISGFVLSFIVLIWCIGAMIGVPYVSVNEAMLATERPSSLAEFTVPAVSALWAIHLLFAGFVFSNVIYFAGIIIGYRRAG